MPYVIPQFNLFCQLWDYPAYTLVPPVPPAADPREVNVPCALVYGRRVNVAAALGYGEFGYPTFLMNLLLPAGTDIRGPQNRTGGPDLVEVPQGSGRYYVVYGVDDIGKGWPNEHRTAAIQSLAFTWSPPYP